jgi:putative ABC transport system ATP-binding protein
LQFTELPAYMDTVSNIEQDVHWIELRNVTMDYLMANGKFRALVNVSLRLSRGACIAIVGKSGSGKSTLLNLIAGIDRPTAGEVFVAGTAVHEFSEDRLAAWRGRHVGVVFQFFQLLPTLTIAENVMLPMDFCHTLPPTKARTRALALLAQVGIADQADKLPSALSGGEQQRAAIARALANDPSVLLADEPTGNLDSQTGDGVLQLLVGLKQAGKTVLIVTHERDIAARVDRVITLADGAVIADEEGRRKDIYQEIEP